MLLSRSVMLVGVPLGIVSATANAAITAQKHDPLADLPVTIGSTIISAGEGAPGRFFVGAAGVGSATPGKFGRYILDGVCQYWFRAGTIPDRSNLDNIFAESYFYAVDDWVDGAEANSDNFIALYSPAEGTNPALLVGILQFAFTNSTTAPKLVGSAYDENGLTFGQGVSAIEAVPEPSAALLSLLGSLLLLGKRRR